MSPIIDLKDFKRSIVASKVICFWPFDTQDLKNSDLVGYKSVIVSANEITNVSGHRQTVYSVDIEIVSDVTDSRKMVEQIIDDLLAHLEYNVSHDNSEIIATFLKEEDARLYAESEFPIIDFKKLIKERYTNHN